MNEHGSGKATRIQVAGLWNAACSLARAVLRTVFDVLEVLRAVNGRHRSRTVRRRHRIGPGIVEQGNDRWARTPDDLFLSRARPLPAGAPLP